MLPFIIAQPDFMNYWSLALGSFSFDGNFVDPPPYNVPQRIQVLLIMAGMPEQAELLDTIIVSGGPMVFSVVIFLGLMILKDRFSGEEKLYFRRILFMTFMMMLLVNILGARGVFKYYFVAIVPFFSIFSSARMIRGTGEHVPFSASMALLPISFTLLILIPDRNFYILYVILIFALYLIAPIIDYLYDYVKRMLQKVTKQIPISFTTLSLEAISSKTKKSVLVNWLTRILSIIVGFSLFVYGLWISTWAVGVNLVVGLSVILVGGIALTLSPQIISIALSQNSPSELNKTLQSFSYVTAAALLVFGIGTYIHSWSLLLYSERMIPLFSGTFIIIWACSLVVDMKLHARFVSDILLLGGVLFGLNAWFSIGNLILQTIGILCLCAVVVHLIVVLAVKVHTVSSLVEIPEPTLVRNIDEQVA
jgi:hypothetical protein